MEVDIQGLNIDGDNQAYGQVVTKRLDSFTALIEHIDPARVSAVLKIRGWSVEEHLNRLMDILEQAGKNRDPRLELSALRELDRLIIRATTLIGNQGPSDGPGIVEIPVKTPVAVPALPAGIDNKLATYLENKTHDQSTPSEKGPQDDSDSNVGNDRCSPGDNGDLLPGVPGAQSGGRRTDRSGSFHRPPSRGTTGTGTPQDHQDR